jgi:hypothetical protein
MHRQHVSQSGGSSLPSLAFQFFTHTGRQRAKQPSSRPGPTSNYSPSRPPAPPRAAPSCEGPGPGDTWPAGRGSAPSTRRAWFAAGAKARSSAAPLPASPLAHFKVHWHWGLGPPTAWSGCAPSALTAQPFLARGRRAGRGDPPRALPPMLCPAAHTLPCRPYFALPPIPCPAAHTLPCRPYFALPPILCPPIL